MLITFGFCENMGAYGKAAYQKKTKNVVFFCFFVNFGFFVNFVHSSRPCQTCGPTQVLKTQVFSTMKQDVLFLFTTGVSIITATNLAKFACVMQHY